ncbi:hypothetical protein ACFSJW_17010 [Flavobacterium artemisiae]|uniref:Uncharacterized protein n=1 Tax=Flavobacterium artemisiae TaxID=2126556 RepID=A0ABW4H9A0_9FLAO
MSGYFNYYKIDTDRTSINLLQKLTDVKLTKKKHHYFPDKLISNFKDYITEINKNSIFTPLSFEEIIFKTKTDFCKINHFEFEAIINWIDDYYNDEVEDIETFHIDLGFKEILTLHSRFENQILSIGEDGLNMYYQKIAEKEGSSKKVDISVPSNAREIELVIDFLIILSIKFIISNIEAYSTEREELIGKLKGLEENKLLTEASNLFFDILEDKKNDYTKLYHDTIDYFIECAESFLYSIEDFKTEITNYDGFVFREDRF